MSSDSVGDTQIDIMPWQHTLCAMCSCLGKERFIVVHAAFAID